MTQKIMEILLRFSKKTKSKKNKKPAEETAILPSEKKGSLPLYHGTCEAD